MRLGWKELGLFWQEIQCESLYGCHARCHRQCFVLKLRSHATPQWRGKSSWDRSREHSQNSMPFPFCQVSRQNGGLTRVFYFSPRFILLHTNFSRVNRALSNLFYIIFFSICCFLKYFAYHQAGFLCNLGRLERCKQESNQAGIQKTGDEVASR